jgi:CelD/BcsL family acetyltransferase involved in cellulose biosynthesis
VRRLELLGSGEDEADETCSEYIGLIAERGLERAVADTFAKAIRAGDLGPWDELVMTRMRGDCEMTSRTQGVLGDEALLEPLQAAPCAVLPESWDGYLAALPSSRRYLVRQSLRAWEKWAKGPPVLRHATNSDELDRGFEALVCLHAQRWGETDAPGAFDSRAFHTFHKRTTRELLENDALWFCWLEVDSEPIGVLYNIVWNNEVRFYQSGRKVGLPKNIRPGLVIHACAIQEAIGRGYSHYDFLGGETRYKMQLANHTRQLVQLSLRRRSLRGTIAGLAVKMVGVGRTVHARLRDLRAGQRDR